MEAVEIQEQPPFWQFLSDWLRTNAWTQTRLADELGLHQTIVGKWLHADPRRRILPGPRTERQLAKVLGVSRDQLDAMIDADPKNRDRLRKARADDGSPEAQVSARRQAVRDQLDAWLNAVGPEYEEVFWSQLKNHGDSTVDLIQRIGTAVNADGEGAVNAAVSDRATRGRKHRNGADGPLSTREHRPNRTLATPHTRHKQPLAA